MTASRQVGKTTLARAAAAARPDATYLDLETAADLAVIWGPQAGRYVLAAGDKLEMTIVPDHQVRADGQPVPFHYSTSVGVRKENGKALLAQIDGVLKKRSKEIQKLLKAEGIPLLPLNEARPTAAAPHRAKKS